MGEINDALSYEGNTLPCPDCIEFESGDNTEEWREKEDREEEARLDQIWDQQLDNYIENHCN